MDIQVIKIDKKTHQVSFELTAKKVTGITKLVQLVVLSLLNGPGQDVLDREKGGGLRNLIGRNISMSDTTELFAEVTQAVRKTESEIVKDQIGLDLDPEEKLNEIAIIDITMESGPDELLVKLRVINENGQISDIMV